MLTDNLNENRTQWISGLLTGTVSGMVITVILLLLAAAAMAVLGIEKSLSSPLSSICVAIGTYIGSYITARKIKSRGLIAGASSALSVYILLSLAACIISGGSLTLMSLIRLIIMLLSGAIGGVIGVNAVRKRKIV